MSRRSHLLDERRIAAESSAEPTRLRLGVLLDEQFGERWIAHAVGATLAIPGAELAAIVMLRRRRTRASAAAGLHYWLDAVDRRLRCREERLIARIDVLAALPPAKRTELLVAARDGTWSVDAQAAAALRGSGVDYWLCCTALRPKRPLLAIASRGVLGLEIGGVPAASPWAGATEVGTGNAATLASVVDYSKPDATLYRGVGATIASSSARNRAVALRRGVNSLVRILAQAAGAGRGLPRPEAVMPPRPAPRPTLGGVARLGRQIVRRVTRNRLHGLRWREQWQIAYQFGDEGTALDFEKLRYLVPPPDRYWADPFALRHANRYFIFFEEARYSDERGRIMAIEVREHAEHGVPQVVLERPYHVSYPFLFRHEGTLYMLPETSAKNRLEVYRCETPPSVWKLHKVLLENMRVFDATLCQEHDRWWLFANVGAPGTDGNDELHLYSSAHGPFGPWRPHRKNPIIADARRARSAGPLFRREGALYRPSQDCTPVYGRSVVVNRIEALDDDDYREKPIGRLDPGWRADVLRVHTLGGSGRLKIIDCSVERQKW
jgi:hypothetical protein